MPRVIGIDIPENKRLEISLTYIYGIGLHRSKEIIEILGLNPDMRANKLTQDDIARINTLLQPFRGRGALDADATVVPEVMQTGRDSDQRPVVPGSVHAGQKRTAPLEISLVHICAQRSSRHNRRN